MEILNRLRSATGPIHGRIELLPACQAMLAGTVAREDYVRLLHSLYHLHRTFEAALLACPEVLRVWPATPSRAEAIARDLATFGVEEGPMPESVNDWVEDIRSHNHVAAWAGCGYVFEGSRMGSRVLARTVARALGLELRLGVGLDYHLDAGEDPNGNWRRIMAALSALAPDDHAQTAMTEAAVRTFEVMYSLHEAVGEPETVFQPVG